MFLWTVLMHLMALVLSDPATTISHSAAAVHSRS